jgi:hypothetical protein
MTTGGAELRFLLLSEDSGKHWPTVQQRLVRLLLRSIDGEVDLARVSFDPITDAAARRSMRANRWREHSPNAPIAEDLRQLLKSIATHVAQSTHFCSFHYDGDRPWAARSTSMSDARFEEVVLARLRRFILQWLEQNGVEPSERDARVSRMLDRVLPIVPYYSVEAWLFQSTSELRVACERRSAEANVVEACRAQCDAWEADRALLDEVEQVKDSVCVRDSANDALALSLTNGVFDAVIATGKSLAATRDRWSRCAVLRDALAAAHP